MQNSESVKTFTKNVGRRNAEISLEQVAAVIMGQLARRDIYITNVEVYEYAKREVSFKETKNGVVIKGRKFSFDQLHGALKAEDDCSEASTAPELRSSMPELRQGSSEANQYDMSEFMPDLSSFKPSLPPNHPGVPQQMPQFNPQLAHQAAQKVAKPKRDPNVPMRHEVFRPSRDDYPVLQRQGFKLTMGRPYPLFGEFIKNEFEPVYYVVADDSGNRIEINSSYFEPMRRGLTFTGNADPAVQPSEGRLAYVDYGSGVVERGGVPVHQMSVAAPPTGNPKLDNFLAAQDAAIMRNR